MGEVIWAMPERNRFFLWEVFPLSVAQFGHHLADYPAMSVSMLGYQLDTTMPSIAKTVMPTRISSKVWQYFVDNKEYASFLLCKYHPSNGVAIFVG